MFSDSQFHPLRLSDGPSVTIWVNDQPLVAPRGWTLAATLLAHGIRANRSTLQDKQPRGAFCMMGVCFECRVTVDNVTNVQACMTPIRDGMKVTLTPALRDSHGQG